MDENDKKKNKEMIAVVAGLCACAVAIFGCGYWLGKHYEHVINNNEWFNTFLDAMQNDESHVYWYNEDRTAFRDFVVKYIGESKV